ncbi:MAG: Chemotaxis protein methyltransferase CheR (EC [uncultured Sulfurovum sp.]|uniref:histidine kinase n=1 Tax=uncultured Sulfurovum sp. TaxID=269237 RepID=A0A6S6SUS4_9BACT|nr:MAG: Chemotaxis protein methyltransferase CheR (EC [uncultured Sulfurovum sp.]
MKKQENLRVVGIGASAGGYEAMQEFFSHLNTSKNKHIAYVITQHLDPARPTMLLELLARDIEDISIVMIEDNMPVVANKIYICPPNNNLTMKDNLFKLSPPLKKQYPKPSVNIFFTSLAKTFESRCLGIIFSGTGSDGCEGIQAIKNAGGITIAQDEKSAKYSSMPKAAIRTGDVDAILTPKEMAEDILKILTLPDAPHESIVSVGSIDTIYDLLIEKFDVDFTDYKLGTIQRRIERRMVVNRSSSLQAYIELLKKSSNELTLLYKDLLIIVTSFFRDKAYFESLEKSILSLVTSNEKRIRVWVAGCATGEEAYSIAMVIHKILDEYDVKKTIQIFATDISEQAIDTARNNSFTPEEIEHIDSFYIDNYFELVDERYEISKRVRESLIFSVHDLVKDPPFLSVDLISCRNLLIYFNTTLQTRIISIFHHSLKNSGILFLGKSEAVNSLKDLYITVDHQAKIFKKDANTKDLNVGNLAYYPKRYSKRIYTGNQKVVHEKEKVLDKDSAIESSMASSIKDKLFKDYLIIDRNDSITYIGGNARRYIDFPIGNFNLDVFSFIKDEIRLDIRVLIAKARKSSASFNKRVKVEVDDNGDKIKYINIIVFPLQNNDFLSDSVALVFMESSDEVVIIKDDKVVTSNYARELETELMLVKEQLQVTIEELETTNEELQSTNEELQSSNEELQSTNEELETSNEELQSSNEELITVNEELETKSSLLRESNSDFENVFRVLDFGMIIVDNNLKIKSFTQEAKEIFEISNQNIHELITTVGTKIDLGNIRELILDVIEKREKSVLELQHEGVHYQITIYPYVNRENRRLIYDGAILTFMDVTYIKESEQKLIESQKAINEEKNRVTKLLDEQETITILTDGKKITSGNKQFLAMFGYESFESFLKVHLCICDLFKDKKNVKHLKAEMDGLLWIDYINKYSNEIHEVYIDDKNGLEHVFVVKASKKIYKDAQVVTFTDITILREHETMLQQQSKMASMGEMIGNIAHQWRQPLNALSASVYLLSSKYSDNDFNKNDMEAFTEKSNKLIQKMSSTINDFKNFFRADKEKVEFKVEEAVKECVDFVNASYISNNIKFIFECEKDLVLESYKNELMQVLLILLNNAKDALVENKINDRKVKVSSKKTNKGIDITIQDNAGGISDAIVKKVFEPYFTTKFQSDGTGIGLYMAKMIVEESMSGYLTLENHAGGALATISFES